LTFTGPQNRGRGTLVSFSLTRLDTLVKSRQMLDYIPDVNCWPAIQTTTSNLSCPYYLTLHSNLPFWSLSLLNLINEPKRTKKISTHIYNYVGTYVFTIIRKCGCRMSCISYYRYSDSKSMKSVTVLRI